VIEELCRRKEIAQVLSLPRSHQDNGRGEPANKEVLRHLKGLLYYHKIREGWHSMLPFVKFVMNNSVHSSVATGYSPLTLLYGATIGNSRQTKELVALANEDTPVVSATQEEYNEWFRNRDTQQCCITGGSRVASCS
jgi:hypothetical protein